MDVVDVDGPVLSISVHPGWAITQLQKKSGDSGNFPGWYTLCSWGSQSAADGSLPLLMGCLAAESNSSGSDSNSSNTVGLVQGDYLGPVNYLFTNLFGLSWLNIPSVWHTLRGAPGRDSIGGFGNDLEQARICWEWSERAISRACSGGDNHNHESDDGKFDVKGEIEKVMQNQSGDGKRGGGRKGWFGLW